MDEPIRVYGFHGTSVEAATSILEGNFVISTNQYDWLGDGFYFWQDAPKRAWEWAINHHKENAAVVRSLIRLEDCIDLLDTEWVQTLKGFVHPFSKMHEEAGIPLPKQKTGAHWLDCKFINFVVGIMAERGEMIKGVRAPFREGNPIIPGSDLFELGHIQIAVRDTAIIERSWQLKLEGGLYR